jgi:hypothetical protein
LGERKYLRQCLLSVCSGRHCRRYFGAMESTVRADAPRVPEVKACIAIACRLLLDAVAVT